MLKFNRSNSMQWNATHLLLVAAVWVLVSAPAAFAATRYVSLTGQDTGSCSDPSKSCKTIKWAIDQAQSGDTISIGDGTYVENVSVLKNLTIQGAGSNPFWPPFTMVEQASGLADAVFETAPGVTATIASMAIHNGKQFGIRNQGILTVKYAFIRNENENGIGIQNQGTLSLERVFLYKSKLIGLQNYANANATLNEVWVTENKYGIATGEGSTLEVSNSVIYNNQLTGVENKGKLTMLNVTISGNGSTGLQQLGIEASLNYVTISANGVDGIEAQELTVAKGGGTNWVTLQRSIVYGNGSTGHKQCFYTTGGPTVPSSPFKDAGYNVFPPNDYSCVPVSSGSTIYDDPKLKQLASTPEEPTLTHALEWTSPAIDMVPSDKCGGVQRDQRNVARPLDGPDPDSTPACDAGAYEYKQ